MPKSDKEGDAPVSHSEPSVEFQLTRLENLIRNEEQLISQRLGWLLACQGFLITAFAIILGSQKTITEVAMSFVIPVAGLWLAYKAIFPLSAAQKTINMLCARERVVVNECAAFEHLLLDNRDPTLHRRSALFPRQINRATLFVWGVALSSQLAHFCLQFQSTPNAG